MTDQIGHEHAFLRRPPAARPRRTFAFTRRLQRCAPSARSIATTDVSASPVRIAKTLAPSTETAETTADACDRVVTPAFLTRRGVERHDHRFACLGRPADPTNTSPSDAAREVTQRRLERPGPGDAAFGEVDGGDRAAVAADEREVAVDRDSGATHRIELHRRPGRLLGDDVERGQMGVDGGVRLRCRFRWPWDSRCSKCWRRSTVLASGGPSPQPSVYTTSGVRARRRYRRGHRGAEIAVDGERLLDRLRPRRRRRARAPRRPPRPRRSRAPRARTGHRARRARSRFAKSGGTRALDRRKRRPSSPGPPWNSVHAVSDLGCSDARAEDERPRRGQGRTSERTTRPPARQEAAREAARQEAARHEAGFRRPGSLREVCKAATSYRRARSPRARSSRSLGVRP